MEKKKTLILTAGAVLLIAAAIYMSVQGLRPSDPVQIPKRLWYYDLETRRLFADAADHVPPFRNDAGHESVLANVFSCKSNCAADLTGKTAEEVAQLGLHIAYLQRLTPSARDSVETFKKTAASPEHVTIQCMQKLVFEGEYRAVDSPTWLPMRSQEFVQVGAAVNDRCPGAVQCQP